MVAVPIPRPIITDGINHFNESLAVPASIISASSGKTGKAIISGKYAVVLFFKSLVAFCSSAEPISRSHSVQPPKKPIK